MTTIGRRPVGLTLLATGCLVMLLVAPSPASADEPTIQVSDFAFTPADVTIDAESAVTWANAGGSAHTVTADDGSFDSGPIPAGEAFANVFDDVGTFPYHSRSIRR